MVDGDVQNDDDDVEYTTTPDEHQFSSHFRFYRV